MPNELKVRKLKSLKGIAVSQLGSHDKNTLSKIATGELNQESLKAKALKYLHKLNPVKGKVDSNFGKDSSISHQHSSFDNKNKISGAKRNHHDSKRDKYKRSDEDTKRKNKRKRRESNEHSRNRNHDYDDHNMRSYNFDRLQNLRYQSQNN